MTHRPIDLPEIAACTNAPGLSAGLFEELMGLVRTPASDEHRLRRCTQTAEGEFAALRGRVATGTDAELAARQLAEAKGELVVAMLLRRHTGLLTDSERKIVTPYLMGGFATTDLPPHPKYRFTSDWVTRYEDRWRREHAGWAGRPKLRFLEIGSYEGRSACWWLDNVLTHVTSSLTCVDPFIAHDTQGDLFDFNVAASGAQQRVKKVKAFSFEVLRTLPKSSFDFVYIDGSHFAADVAKDALLGWPLLKIGVL